ncbi:uncharacterized protein TNCV_1517431 [Trichonephila clavipes]|nr:uncharacterized protein TNCV_1517431 [Trichonephila clavipes]
MIDLITTYYGNAIRQNKTCLSDMRKAVWAVYFHIRSSDEEPLHSFCPVGPNSWCKYQNQVVEGSVETFRHSNKLPVAVMDAIKPVFNDLSQPKFLQKCLGADYPLSSSSLRELTHSNDSDIYVPLLQYLDETLYYAFTAYRSTVLREKIEIGI